MLLALCPPQKHVVSNNTHQVYCVEEVQQQLLADAAHARAAVWACDCDRVQLRVYVRACACACACMCVCVCLCANAAAAFDTVSQLQARTYSPKHAGDYISIRRGAHR